jgi:HAD superfamily hydrolase (TIGR01493 family)
VRYRGILLDVYGTILRDGGQCDAVVRELAERAGVAPGAVEAEWDKALWALAEPAHGPDFRTLEDLYVSSLATTAGHFGVGVDAGRMWRAAARVPEIFDDVRPFLDALSVPVCLVSDADRAELETHLAHHGIVVEAIVTSEDARAYKPRPEPFRLALRQLGLEAGEVLHVGDTPASDIVGAAALGIDTALVSRDGRTHPAATFTVRTLAEVTN